MSNGTCIDCKKKFNRSIAVDKLRCPNCTKPEDLPPEPWKKDLLKKKGKLK